ncbi:HNH endonuclease [Actinorhabdospora filicis]|uniref:HNH endonuclease n=1 Tax=Actinorhabdospora filicis TaxID=1785913 RepID=UPI002556C90E|nr:HNH endonuclease [Actinorhabdospora filicis]
MRPGRSANASAALVLNATYEPLCVVSVRRAAVLLLSDKAEAITHGEGYLQSHLQTIPIPSVVRLNKFVKVPHRRKVSLSRRAIFARDKWKCVYCGGPAETIDHVIPRSKGGAHIWENVVAACARCNHKKGDKTVREMGWRLAIVPAVPKGAAWRVLGHRTPDPRWELWLGARN